MTASQIRQDLNNFGGFGQQGYGYNVQYLYDEIGKILGLNERHNIIVIGAGNLGQAITNYVKFEKFGFMITALFDVNPKLKGQTVRRIPIYLMEDLDEYCKDHRVDIAARIIAAYELTFAGFSFMKSAGVTWPLFYTGVFYLAFVGILTLLFNYIERRLDYFK